MTNIQVNSLSNMAAGIKPAATMTDDQVNTVLSVLEQYDAESLTEDDAKAIVSAFHEAGIRPNSELKELMQQAGFDAGQVGELSGIAGPKPGKAPPPPPQGATSNSVNQQALQVLQSILSQYDDLAALNDEEQQQLNNALYSAGLLEPGALINTQS